MNITEEKKPSTAAGCTNVDDLLASVLVEKVKEEEEERRKEEEKKKEEEDEELLYDSSDIICGVCELGGDLICCDGRCLRSFHPGMYVYVYVCIYIYSSLFISIHTRTNVMINDCIVCSMY